MDDNKITLGCDPEYVIRGHDNALYPADEIGVETDTNHAIAELRPHCNSTVNGLLRNLCNDIIQNYYYVIDYKGDYEIKMVTQDTEYPIGGHIHLNGKVLNERQQIFGMLMDAIIWARTLPYIDINSHVARRTHGGRGSGRSYRYGIPSDIRDGKSHGGFEYRTLGSWWLNTPELAETILGMTLFIANICSSRDYFLFNISNILNKTVWDSIRYHFYGTTDEIDISIDNWVEGLEEVNPVSSHDMELLLEVSSGVLDDIVGYLNSFPAGQSIVKEFKCYIDNFMGMFNLRRYKVMHSNDYLATGVVDIAPSEELSMDIEAWVEWNNKNGNIKIDKSIWDIDAFEGIRFNNFLDVFKEFCSINVPMVIKFDRGNTYFQKVDGKYIIYVNDWVTYNIEQVIADIKEDLYDHTDAYVVKVGGALVNANIDEEIFPCIKDIHCSSRLIHFLYMLKMPYKVLIYGKKETYCGMIEYYYRNKSIPQIKSEYGKLLSKDGTEIPADVDITIGINTLSFKDEFYMSFYLLSLLNNIMFMSTGNVNSRLECYLAEKVFHYPPMIKERRLTIFKVPFRDELKDEVFHGGKFIMDEDLTTKIIVVYNNKCSMDEVIEGMFGKPALYYNGKVLSKPKQVQAMAELHTFQKEENDQISLFTPDDMLEALYGKDR